MKKIIALLLAGCLLLGLVGCGKKKKEEETPVIRVGVLEPFSGEESLYGWQEYLGVVYANRETSTVKIGKTTCQVELYAADNQAGEPDENGVSAAARALIEGDVSLVIGSFGNSLTEEDSAAFEREGIPILSATGTAKSLTENNDHVFRLSPSDELTGSVLASFARSRWSENRLYCLYEQGDTEAETILRSFRAAAEEQSLSVMESPFLHGCGDFTAYFRQMLDAEADVIVFLGGAEYAEVLLGQMRTLSLTFPVLAGTAWDSGAVLSAAKGSELSVYVASHYAEGTDTEFESGLKAFLEENPDWMAANGGGDAVSYATALGYDAYGLALGAMQTLGSVDKADILAGLPAVSSAGVAGTIRFDEDGCALRESLFLRKADTENGTWLYVSKQNA